MSNKTINEHIEVLKSYNHGFTGYAGNLQDSIDVAINTMRKYQKIEQIVKRAESLHPEIAIGDREAISRISEVLKA